MSPVKKALNIGAVVTMIGVLVAVGAAAGTAIMHAARGMGQVQTNTDGIEKNGHDIREHAERNQRDRDTVDAWRREIETTTTKTSTDVEWIRETMEKEHP